MLAILNLVPRWALAAVIAMLAATSCKFKWENGQLSIEVEKHATKIAQLESSIHAANEASAKQAAKFEQQARAAEQARATREKALVADAAGAKSELDRLRVAVSTYTAARVTAKPSAIGTGLDAADPFPELFVESAGRYADLAATCDRHVNDIKTLIDAWPR